MHLQSARELLGAIYFRIASIGLAFLDAYGEKVGLKLNIQKTKITASSAITSWKIDGETMETVRDFPFWARK